MDEDITHWEQLILEHTRHLRVLETQAAGFGKLHVPAHIVLDMDNAKREIQENTQRIRRRIRNAETDDMLYNAEELDGISDKIARIAELRQLIPMQEGTVTTLKGAFYWKHQSLKAKSLMIAVLFLALFPLMRLIADTLSSDDSIWQKVIITLVVLLVLTILAFMVRKWIKNDFIGLVRDLDVKVQHNKDELERQKTELSKIYKVAE